MLADNDMNIIYMNDEVMKMLQGRERELQKYLPNFNVDKLIGTNVDGFHKNPSHQRKMVREITEPYNTRLNFDTLNFELTATPWGGTDGSRIGTVVEWGDITDTLKAREEEVRISNANSQVKQALDCLTANAMIADGDGNIIYMNDAVKSMMRDAESDLRKELPGFDAKHLVGENLSLIHI